MSTAMQDCSSRRSLSDSGISSPCVPDQPIQTPPACLRMGSMAVAKPPELLFAFHSFSSFTKETGSRFETTIKRELFAMHFHGLPSPYAALAVRCGSEAQLEGPIPTSLTPAAK